MNNRINNSQACICCGRRADGLAVGEPNKLGWYCLECGPGLAKVALAMTSRDFDIIERRAIEAVAQKIGGDVTLTVDEMADFIKWLVGEYAQAMRSEIENGGAPF